MHTAEAVPLLVIALGAFFVPLAAGRIGVPAAVGELLFGVLVGPAVLGWFRPTGYSHFLSELGFALLMFLAGLEIDFTALERQGRAGLLRAALAAGLVNAAALGLVIIAGYPPFLFVAFGAMSVGILLATLAEAGQARTPTGQTTILVGSIGEFLTIVLLTGFSFYYRFGLGGRLALEMAKLAGILAAAYLALVVLRTLIWWYPRQFARVVAAHDPSEVGVRAGMALMLVFVALAALMGVESILGAFIAGALFSAVFRERGALEAKLSSIGFGFFVPVFFIYVGATFDLGPVMRLSVIPLVLAFGGLSLLAKAAGVLPLALAGLPLRASAATTLILSAPLTLLVVIARLGQEARVLGAAEAGALVLLAVVSSVVFPWSYRALAKSPVSP